MLLILALAACSPKEGGDDTGGGGDTDAGNPIVPEAYEYVWDIDASDCEGEGDAVVYWLFEGAIDDAGVLTGTEGWYWFFGQPDWAGDCVDTFTVEGEQDTFSWSEEVCYGCERAFDARWGLDDADRGCGGHDYETFWELEDEDADRYNVDVLFDALSPSGNPNADNQMLVVASYVGSDGSRWYNPSYGRGTYTPVTEGDYEGAATIGWVAGDGICVTFTEAEE